MHVPARSWYDRFFIITLQAISNQFQMNFLTWKLKNNNKTTKQMRQRFLSLASLFISSSSWTRCFKAEMMWSLESDSLRVKLVDIFTSPAPSSVVEDVSEAATADWMSFSWNWLAPNVAVSSPSTTTSSVSSSPVDLQICMPTPARREEESHQWSLTEELFMALWAVTGETSF